MNPNSQPEPVTPSEAHKELARQVFNAIAETNGSYAAGGRLIAEAEAKAVAADRECTRRVTSFDLQGINRIVADQTKNLRAQIATLEQQRAQLRETLKLAVELAEAIHRNIDEEKWTVPQDELWVPTIHAHATVIKEDCSEALATTQPGAITDAERVQFLEDKANGFSQTDWRITQAPGQQHRIVIRTGHTHAFGSLREAIDAAIRAERGITDQSEAPPSTS